MVSSNSMADSVLVETEKLITMIKFKDDEDSKESTKSFIDYLKKLKEAKLGINKANGSSNRFSILDHVSVAVADSDFVLIFTVRK